MPLIIFSLSIFLSSVLLFMVQPMAAKVVLPVLGGAPQVWNTCMVFFQALLLAGYAYAHYSLRFLGKYHLVIHLSLMLAVFIFLPLTFPPTIFPEQQTQPALWLIGQLSLFIALPFFLLSSTAPLLQRWYGAGDASTEKDPYFLYAASNLGSLLALVSYPLIIETRLGLARQLDLWSQAYFALFILLGSAIYLTYRKNKLAIPRSHPVTSALGWQKCLRWIVLAFVPSSMMLGLTSFITADLAAAPLVWVLPLSLYLLSFVLTFSKRVLIPHHLFVYCVPALLIVLAMLLVSDAVDPLSVFIPIHVLVFFAVSMLCHGELVKDRPAVSDLTLFYLMMSIGGVLGGFFNAIVSPAIFNDVLEYPIILVIAALMCPSRQPAAGQGITWNAPRLFRDLVFASSPAIVLLFFVVALPDSPTGQGTEASGFSTNMLIAFGLSLLFCYLTINNAARFALALSLWMMAGYSVYESDTEDTLLAERSYFGVHSVRDKTDTKQHLLYHGSTVHGLQNQATGLKMIPGMYYHPSGPAGQVLRSFADDLKNIGVVGLGTGALSAYAGKNQNWTYFEIDPVIKNIAETESLFSFNSLARRKGANVEVVLGDARISLVAQPDSKFDVLVIDAFSSGTIPVHLLTLEAISLYRTKTHSNGLLLFHISNHYLELYPVLSRLALELKLEAYIQNNIIESAQEKRQGKSASQWLLLVTPGTDISRLETGVGRWLKLKRSVTSPLWTDNFSSIVDVLKL